MKRVRFFCSFLATVLLTALLCSALFPTSYATPSTSAQIQKKIDEYYYAVKATVGTGETPHWNASQNETTLRQYADRGQYGMSVRKSECSGKKRETGCVSNTFGGGSQCFGFAKYMCYVVFGNYPQYAHGQELGVGYVNDGSWSYYMGGTYPGLQAGDMIRFWYYSINPKGENVLNIHAAVVYSVSQGRINVIDCNHSADVNGKCKIDKCSPITEKKFKECFASGTAYICRNKGVTVTVNGSTNTSVSTGTSFGTATTGVADTITQTSAILRGSVSSTGAKMTQCGMLLGTTTQNMTRLGYDSINTYSTTCFYSTSKYGRTLTPGTTYYYQAYAVVDGKEYKGNVRSFTTKPCTNHVKGTYLWYNSAHPHYDYYTCAVCGQTFRDTKTNYVSTCEICNPPKPCNHVKGTYLWYNSAHPHYDYYQCAICGQTYRSTVTNCMPTCEICCPVNAYGIRFSGLSATNITASSVKLNASCAYTGSRPTSVGVYLGTTPNNIQIKGSDGNINHNKNPFDIWYNLNGLTAGTTYYYRFYAVVDGKTSYSEIKFFTTSAAR